MLQSLRARLFASHLAVIALVFVITAAVAYLPIRRAENRLKVQRLESLAAPLALQTGFILRRQPASSSLANELLDVQARRIGARLVLFDGQGAIVHDTGGGTELDPAILRSVSPRLPEVANENVHAAPATRLDVPVLNLGTHRGQRVLLAPVPQVSNRVLGFIVPVTIFPLAQDVLLPLLPAALVGLLAALVATLFLSHSIARPITRLTRAADAMTGGDLHQHVPGEDNDEVGRLIRSFNKMAERLEAAAASQRRLLANIAHELRTPLTSIQGYAQALEDGLLPDPVAQREALATIGEESERVNQLVVQILQLARLESGQAAPDLTDVALAPVLARIVRRHRIDAEAGTIALVTEAGDGAAVWADEALLEQAIDNLVRNAIQHTPRGGRVTIETRPAAALDGHTPALAIRVSDTGRGIPPEEISHIFDRFYRADGANGRAGGFGLGLAIVREIAASHHGSVAVQSDPGHGATFVITLPRAETDATANPRGSGNHGGLPLRPVS